MNELHRLSELREIAPGAELDARVRRCMQSAFESEPIQTNETRASRRVEDLALALLVSAFFAYAAPVAALMLFRLVAGGG